MSDVATSAEVSGGILAGHDGSRASGQGVRWAGRLAQRLGCQLHVARSWSLASAPRPSSWEPGYVPPLTDYEEAVLERLQQDVAGLDLPSDVTVTCHVLHGSAGARLVEASEQVEMLVVPSRGRGGFRELVLGSTADQAVRHAYCPVVVIPVRALDLDDGDLDADDVDADD